MFELSRRNNDRQVASYNPFREMEEWEKRFFENPFGAFMADGEPSIFKTDVTDEGDHYLLEADLPGFDKKDIQMDISDDLLTIKAERHSKYEEKDQKDKIVRVERSYGSYCRSFDVSGIAAEGIKAKYENGVLRLELPKKQIAAPETRHLELE